MDVACIDRAHLKQWQEFQVVMGLDAGDDHPKNEALKVINEYLADRTTLGGTRITEADKLVFEAIYKSYRNLSYAEKESFIHVSRWCNFMQNQDDIIGSREKITFSRNQLYK